MASFQLFFSPRSIESFVSIIRPVSEELTILEARLLGRAGDLEEGFDSAAVHFTDLIGWDIKSLGSEDYQAWVDAAVNLRFARDVNDMWADYVQEFWDTRNEIWDDWDAAVEAKAAQVPAKYQGTTITSTVPDPAHWFDSDAKKCRELYDELSGYLEEIKEREQANWDRHEENAIEISSMLLQGPTDVNVQKLIDGGYANMAYANLDPDKYLFLESDFDLSPESAEQTADELASYWSGEKPLDDRYHELVLVMSMIGTNARTAQNDGKPLDSEEMAFLDAFYERLESENTPGPGVLGVPAQMEGEHLTDEEREHALGVLGDGLLALSDPNLGGGYEDLPASIRTVVEGPILIPQGDESEAPYLMINYQEDMRALSSLFAYTNKELEGGYGLSTTLNLSIGTYLEQWGSEGQSGWLTSEELAPIIDASTRNADANHFILTGEHSDREEGVTFDESARLDAFTGLLTYDWHDDGASARQLLDWMAEGGDSDDTDLKEKADKAMEGFIDLITRPDIQEALLQTGNKIEDTFTTVNRDGKEVTEDFEWRDVSMGHLNPDFADSMAGIFETYIATFADPSVVEGNTLTPGVETSYDKKDGLVISLDDRRAFTQFIAGDPEAAMRMLEITDEYTKEGIDAYFAGSTKEDSVRNIARETGLLWNAVGSGISDEATYRSESHASDLATEKKNKDFVVDFSATFIPNPQLAETYKFFAKEFVSTTVDGGQEVEVRNFDDYSPAIRAQAEVGALGFYADMNSENWGEEPWLNGPLHEEMYDKDQKFIRDQLEWQNEEKSNDTDKMRDNAWNFVSDLPIPGREPERTFYAHTDEYMETLGEMMRISTR